MFSCQSQCHASVGPARFPWQQFRGHSGCGLTLRSSGPPPAGHATLAVHFPLRVPSRFRPLSSNVRPHVNQFLLNAAFGAPGSEYKCARALGNIGLCLLQASNLRAAEPQKKMHWQRSLSAPPRRVGPARPLAGGSPAAALAKIQEQAVLWRIAAAKKAGRIGESVAFRQAPVHTRRQMPKPCCNVLGFAVRPNTSIEPTSTGWPRYAHCPFSASRAQPAPAAHVKR